MLQDQLYVWCLTSGGIFVSTFLWSWATMQFADWIPTVGEIVSILTCALKMEWQCKCDFSLWFGVTECRCAVDDGEMAWRYRSRNPTVARRSSLPTLYIESSKVNSQYMTKTFLTFIKVTLFERYLSAALVWFTVRGLHRSAPWLFLVSHLAERNGPCNISTVKPTRCTSVSNLFILE